MIVGVTFVMAWKLATTFFVPFIARSWWLTEPVRSPEKLANAYPAAGVASNPTVPPAYCQPPAVTAPPPAGFAAVVN